MAFAAFPLIAAASGITAVGQLYQGYAQGKQYSAAANNADANADRARLVSSANEDSERRKARLMMGQSRAMAAQSGFDPSSGTLAEIQSRNAGELELDILTNRYSNELQALSFENEAASMRSQAKATRISSGLSAAGAIFGGMAAANARTLPGFETFQGYGGRY